MMTPEARKEYHRKWYIANRERVRENGRKWKTANREKHLAYNREYGAAHPESRRTATKKWRQANPERVRAMMRKNAGYPDATRPQPELCERGCGRKATHLDHDHITGNFRGWLCLKCNTGIGMLGDTLEDLIASTNYLKRAIQ